MNDQTFFFGFNLKLLLLLYDEFIPVKLLLIFFIIYCAKYMTQFNYKNTIRFDTT